MPEGRVVSGAALDADIRGQSVDGDALDHGVFPFDAWDFIPDDVAPLLELKTPWDLNLHGDLNVEGTVYGRLPVHVVSSAGYNILDDDGYSVFSVTTGADDRTITLPTAADNSGRVVIVVKVDSGVGSVIVDGEGAEVISGESNVTLASQYDYVVVSCNGTGWDNIGDSSTYSGLLGVHAISADYTVLDDDGYGFFPVTAAADVTITLPTAADSTGREIRVTKVDTGSGSVIVDGEGSEYVGFGNSVDFRLYEAGDTVTIICDGTKWWVTSTNGPRLFYTSASDVNASTGPTTATWYNPTSHSIALPIGVWEVWAAVKVRERHNLSNTSVISSLCACLSSASNSSAYGTLRQYAWSSMKTGYTGLSYASISAEDMYSSADANIGPGILELDAATTIYLNVLCEWTSSVPSQLGTWGTIQNTQIVARRWS